MLCVWVVSTGGERKRKGRKAVDFEQGTWVAGKFATMKEGLPPQVSGFLIFNQLVKCTLILNTCVYSNKKELSVQVKNKPSVKIWNIFLSLYVFWQTSSSFFCNLLLCCPSQWSAQSQVPSQVATHQEICSQLWAGETPDSDPGLQDNSLAA